MAARSERAGFERRRRDRDWPMPARGWFGDAGHAEIDPAYAALLENLWWRSGKLVQRPGYTAFAPTIARQRITHALTGGAPITITVFPSYIEAGAASLARTTPARMMSAQISNATIMVDGAGPIVRFNGTALETPEFTGSGLTPNALDGVVAHHDRLFFWQSGGPLEFWYGGLGAVQGALTKFPLGRLGNIEGGIAAMGRFTSDAGENVNDLLVILTTAGDVAIYEGLDPGLTDSWRIWGRLKLAPPVTRYALLNYGPDLLVLTTQGIASIGQAMGRGAPSLVDALSTPIRQQMSDAIAAAPTSPRWQMLAAPSQQFVVVNTPQDKAFVFDPAARGWYLWSGLPALNWRVMGDGLYWTKTTGQEARFGDSASDEGAAIVSTWWSAWTRRVGPHVATVKPVIRSAGPLAVSASVLADHADTARDLSETAQTVTIAVENPADSAAQSHDEPVLVSITGEVLQLRLSFAATGAEIVAVRWTG